MTYAGKQIVQADAHQHHDLMAPKRKIGSSEFSSKFTNQYILVRTEPGHIYIFIPTIAVGLSSQ